MVGTGNSADLTILRSRHIGRLPIFTNLQGTEEMSNAITITKANGTWVVRAGGAVLGETSDALELVEGDLRPVIYFPRADVATAFLDPSDHTTHCPHKGDATHYSIVTKSTTLKNAAWSYENPLEDVARIKGYLAFYKGDKVAIEQV